ncbi:MAG: DPP IV N-terminal domain-containing protein [Ignavibacteria bacterium]|nr:DPP IV N-terminal domain-containing protein [Ignavibacteria bacterium]
MKSVVRVCVIIAFLVSGSAGQSKTSLTVERIFQKPALDGVRVSNIRWSPDGSKVCYLRIDATSDFNDLWWFDVSSGKSSLLVKSEVILRGEQKFSKEELMMRERTRQTGLGITKYVWAPDGNSVFFPIDGDVYVFDANTRKVSQRTKTADSEFDPKIAPAGGQLSYVRGGEIYTLDLKSDKETKLTSGATDKIKNGISEFIAQEEMGRTTGYWWSPDSKHISYLQIDNTPVGEFKIPDYLTYYTDIKVQEYAKAGQSNTLVKVGVVPATGGKTTWLDLGQNRDIYVARVDWLPDGQKLAVQLQTRSQDTLDLCLYDIKSVSRTILLREIDSKWVSLHDELRFLHNRKQFLWSSERDGFKHLYLFDMNGEMVNRVTKGTWDIDKLIAVDEEKGMVYFTANKESPLERHFYSVKLDGSDFRRLSRSDGWHEVVLSPDFQRFIDTYSNLLRPPLVSLESVSRKSAVMVEANPTSELDNFALPKPELITFESDAGHELHAFIIKPSTFDVNKQYPVIVYVYGGPTSQIVADRWGAGGGMQRALWHRSMAEKGYIVFGVDGRGTPGRGREFQNHIHKRLGYVEVKDQISGVNYLRTLPFVDSSRIMIWGKSYGGYMTCMAMFTTGSPYKFGMAVAPVTDWRNYDTHYTERYLERPQDNPEGYRLSSPINFVNGLQRKLLVVHGIADDNVHFQDSVILAEELQKANKQFDFMPYPRSTHSFSGDVVGTHLYNLLSRYIQENL